MWFWLSLIALLCWSGSDLFSKIGCRDADDKYSHLKMVIAVGTVMGLHAAFEIFVGGTEISWDVIWTYLPVSLLYIGSMTLGSREAMVAFCRGIQAAAPVDSYVTPEPWAMPGYDSEVIMAAGAFVQGSSIELSADGPIRPPYAVYFQGGLTWYHAKLGILMSLQKLLEAGLTQLP